MKHLDTVKVALGVIITVMMWSSAFVGIRYGLHGYSPGALAFLRYLVASVCMLLLMLRVRHPTKLGLRDGLKVFVLGFVGFGVYNVALNYGEVSVPAGIASFIVSLIPVAIVVLAVMFLGERLNWGQWVGTGVCVLGVVVIAVGEHAGVAFDYGVLFTVIATLAGGVYSAFQKPLLKRFNPLELTAYTIWAGTLSMSFFAPALLRDIHHATTAQTLSVIYLGIFPGALTYWCWSYVVSRLPVTTAGTFLYAMPIVVTFMGWALLSEIPEVISIIGGLIALLGVIVVNCNKAKRV